MNIPKHLLFIKHHMAHMEMERNISMEQGVHGHARKRAEAVRLLALAD